ncbi:MAG: sugar transferase [Deltaproteobacteria bacterium]|nr:sugar transferase [Deltaproteobacteria bacterium]
MAKRLFDIVLSLVGLIILSPLFLVISILVYIKMGRPILFKQVRIGFKGKTFTLYKFRTMTNAKDSYGNLLPDAERLTDFGRWLRRTSLDELPQLWNVLKGDLSFVGPRPLLPEYLPFYTPEQAKRHDVKPGITGWAQINGRNALTWEEKFKLDAWYVENRSFWLDLKILFRTLIEVVTGQGISYPGHETMPKFDIEIGSSNSKERA